MGTSKTMVQEAVEEFRSNANGQVVLVLQGGGALGAYQVGVYAALHEAGVEPDWIVGTSIGAINAAIIAGNAPERRVDKLREFWEEITAPPMGFDTDFVGLFGRGEAVRALANQVSAVTVATAGSPGFFGPRIPNPWFHLPGTIEATSYYDTRPLRATLERFVDFDRVNSEKLDTRLSLGAVNVRSGGRTLLGWRPRLEYAASVGCDGHARDRPTSA